MSNRSTYEKKNLDEYPKVKAKYLNLTVLCFSSLLSHDCNVGTFHSIISMGRRTQVT